MSDPLFAPYDAHKKLEHERIEGARDRLHEYISETRHRVDTLIKAMFVLCGGALTISIGIFLRPDAPTLTIVETARLRWSWGLLFASVAAGALLMFVMICQGYVMAADTERQLSQQGYVPPTRFFAGKTVQKANWFIGTAAVIAFLIGIFLLACVSISAAPQHPNPPATFSTPG